MNMLILMGAILLGTIVPEVGGVILEKPYRERAAAITERGVQTYMDSDSVFALYVQTQLPPAAPPFTLTIYHDSKSPESRLLVEDFARHPGLIALRDWANFVVIDRSTQGVEGQVTAAQARHMMQRLDGSMVPSVFLASHPEHPTFGRGSVTGEWRYVYQTSGYGGDAALLARNIYQALVTFYSRHDVPQAPVEYQPSAPCPRDPGRPRWPPVRPIEPDAPPLPPPWDTPDEEPDKESHAFGTDSIPPWAWVALGVAIAVGLHILIQRMEASKAAKLLLVAAVLSASAATAGEPPQDEEIPDRAEEIVEEAYHYPPVPDDWEWLDMAVRDEVRRAIDPPQTEWLLNAALDAVEHRIDRKIDEVRTDVRKEVKKQTDTAWWWAVAIVVAQALNLAAAIYRAKYKPER